MKTLKSMLLASALLVGAAGTVTTFTVTPVYAEVDANKKEHIDKLVKVLGFKADMEKGSKMVMGAREKMMRQALLGPEAKKALKEQGAKDADLKKLETILNGFFKKANGVIDGVVKENLQSLHEFYSKNFSVDELKALVEAHSKPEAEKNRKLLRDYQPEMMKTSMKNTEEKVRPIAEKFDTELKAWHESLPKNKKS